MKLAGLSLASLSNVIELSKRSTSFTLFTLSLSTYSSKEKFLGFQLSVPKPSSVSSSLLSLLVVEMRELEENILCSGVRGGRGEGEGWEILTSSNFLRFDLTLSS